ncbi:MAG: ATP-binding protein [Caldilineaceae bacterium]|nr:ATP-binding protein [Caldilineaceae bacterium]
MSRTPFELAGSLQIGTVDFVSPDKIEVVLIGEAPESTALNAGVPRPFPRVNDYLLVPVDESFLVGQVEWITIDRSPLLVSRGMQNSGLVDLPFSRRKLRLNPLGTLRAGTTDGQYVFQRGTDALPSIGVAVLLPTENQLRSVVENDGEQGHVKIGSSPLAGNAEVRVDPNRLFGRHFAVLGNTGSGKSCSVAGLIRWSVEQAQRERCSRSPNARFVVLDPNGEYSRAFGEDDTVQARVFKVDAACAKDALKVPLWFWNSAEWCSFTQASTKTQRPTLMHALRFVRDGHTEPPEDASHALRRFLRTLVAIIRIDQGKGDPWAGYSKSKSFLEKIVKWKSGLEPDLEALEGDQQATLQRFIDTIDELSWSRSGPGFIDYNFTRQEVQDLLSAASAAHSALGGTPTDIIPSDVDAPLPFQGTSLLRGVEAAAEMLNVSEYVETLLVRIRALLTDTRLKPIMDSTDEISLEQWLNEYIGSDNAENFCVSVIDLSLVPSEVVHIITAVIARMIFEAHQRYVKLKRVALPTVLVMEEAHTFIKRYKDDAEYQDAATVCCQAFERIAREGRKFGLGLVLSSQRPSELSPTVLSQCNTFLLHRISNDRDQEIVHRLVPDNLRGLLRELPSLPSQRAILLGWAAELPVLVKMNDLPEKQQPRSDDPEFWKVWTGEEPREVNWDAIAEDWQGKVQNSEMETEHVSMENGSNSDNTASVNEGEEDIPF